MSSDDHDITKIEDIPDIDVNDLDDDFQSLDDLANDMGLLENDVESDTNVEIDHLTNNDLPSLPDLDGSEDEEFTGVNDISTVDDASDNIDDTNPPDFFNENNEEFNSEFDKFEEDSEVFNNEDGTNFDSLDNEFEGSTIDSSFDSTDHDDNTDFDSNIPTDHDELTADQGLNLDIEEDDSLSIDENMDELLDFNNLKAATVSEPNNELQEVHSDQNDEPAEMSSFDFQKEKNKVEEEKDKPISTELTSLDELNKDNLAELPLKTKTPIVEQNDEDIDSERIRSLPQERFEDVKRFSENMTSGNFSQEGNPPYSIILKDIKFYEDVDSIIDILSSLKIINQGDIDQTRQSLERGQLLIPRLGEFAAITLCHKFRGYDIEIIMGLTEELHPPKSYESNDRGLSSKYSVYNNKKTHYSFDSNKVNSEVLVSTMPKVDGHKIIKYIGVATKTRQITEYELRISNQVEEEIIQSFDENEQLKLNEMRIARENLLASSSNKVHNFLKQEPKASTTKYSLESIYRELTEEIKIYSKDKNANGVIGLNFSITPISLELNSTGPIYQILCTGNMVWLEKN